MTENFAHQPNPLRRCSCCGLLAPSRLVGCCICNGRAPRREVRPGAEVPVLVTFDLYGPPHQDREVEAAARRRAGTPPRKAWKLPAWVAALAAHRQAAEAAILARRDRDRVLVVYDRAATS